MWVSSVTLLIINMQALTLHLWVINRCPVYHSTFLPLNQTALDGKDSITGRWNCFYPHPSIPCKPVHMGQHMSHQWWRQPFTSLSPNVKMKRKIKWVIVTLLIFHQLLSYGGKVPRELIFSFCFSFISVFRHYVATAIITHGYKYHSLPLLVDLQIFSVSTPFSNTILCETSIYKTDKGTLCECSVC